MIVSVASGKGGTGKTTVATSLALAVNTDIQFLDCDVEAPNASIFLKPELREAISVHLGVPALIEERCTFCRLCSTVCEWNAIAVVGRKWLFFPGLCHGCSACWQLCPEKALQRIEKEQGVVEKGRAGKIDFVQGKLTIGQAAAPPVIKAVKREADPLKRTIIDIAPGTACPMVEGVKGTHFCLLVTEPTPFGLNDLQLAVAVLESLNIPHAVVINRSMEGDDSIGEFCVAHGIPVLLRIPLDRNIAKGYSEGKSLVDIDPIWREKFRKLFLDIEELAGDKVKKCRR